MNGEHVRRDVTLDDLLEAGRQALAAGEKRAAHNLWRQAAVTNPYDERVWSSLMDVLVYDDDREVCLENIIAINPLNTEARRQLRTLKRARHTKEETPEVEITPLPTEATVIEHPAGQRSLGEAIVAGIGVGLVAVILGIIASIFVYGGILAKLVP